MKTFYHIDMDGICSGAIVRQFFNGEGEYIPYNYGEFPFDEIEFDETVILVDCSCDFEKLLKITKNIIWIDHHKTAIEKYEYLGLHGEIEDGIAACELTWDYFYNNAPNLYIAKIPEVVKLLGDYDVWKFEYEHTNELQTGLRLYDTSIESENWNKWLDVNYYPCDEIEKGKIALQYRNNYYARLVKSYAFIAGFQGYKTICLNACSVSSQVFDSIDDDYDIMLTFCYGKNFKFNVSLYTKKNIDVSEIAKIFGGGGHAKAAGFKHDDIFSLFHVYDNQNGDQQ